MSEAEPIRVILVDDHAMLRKGLRFFLAGFDDLELVGEAASAKEAIRQCAELQPDVVLMDMIMPDMDGAAATQTIREQSPEIHSYVLQSIIFVQRHNPQMQKYLQLYVYNLGRLYKTFCVLE